MTIKNLATAAAAATIIATTATTTGHEDVDFVDITWYCPGTSGRIGKYIGCGGILLDRWGTGLRCGLTNLPGRGQLTPHCTRLRGWLWLWDVRRLWRCQRRCHIQHDAQDNQDDVDEFIWKLFHGNHPICLLQSSMIAADCWVGDWRY